MGAMRKMAVYLGLVEDDGYDGRGFDPDDDFEPELDPEPERDRRRHEPPHQSHQAHSSQRDEPVRVVQPSAPRDPVPGIVEPASPPANGRGTPANGGCRKMLFPSNFVGPPLACGQPSERRQKPLRRA